MDQPLLAEMAQKEADTNNLDVLSHPCSPTPHHRSSHSGVHHHHESHHHSGSPHHSESHHHGGSPHHGESHHLGGSHHHRESNHLGESHHLNESHHHSMSHHHGTSHHSGRSHHHGTSHHPGGSHHHGISHHHGGSHHVGEFQDFHDNASSHHSFCSHRSHHHGGAHHYGGTHHFTSLALTPHGTDLSHHSNGEGHFDGEYHHASRGHHDRPHHHGGPQHHSEPYHDSGAYHHRGAYHHSEPYHQSGSYQYDESYHHGGPHHHRRSHHHGGFYHHGEVSRHSRIHSQGEPYHHKDSYTYGGSHHDSEAYYHGRHRHHEARHHRGPLYHGETLSHPSYEGSYHDHIPHYYDEYHQSHRSEHHGHHGKHHHGHHGEHHHGHHVALQPSKLQIQHSAFSLTRSRSAVHSHGSQVSNKVHPQDSSSKTSSESWTEEDEQFQKRKTGRAQRSHKKLHTVDLFYRLWEKLSYLIQGLRRMLRNLTESLAFEAFIFLTVCLNTIMLVAQTFAEVEVRGEWYFMAFDSIFLCIYVVEAVLKIIALGLKYFSDSWNNLDFFIMIMAMLDFLLLQFNSFTFVYHQSVFRIFKVFKSLRALRAIRVLRRLSILTSLQEVTGTLARSLPSITAILILMFTCLFLFSVVLRALFRLSDPKRFQSIFTTIFTLFTLLTLDDWSSIYLDSRAQGAWHIIPILMIYIIIQYFIFLNLVIAVLVDNFQMALLKGLEKVKQERAARIHEKLLDDSLTELSKSEPEEVVSEHTKQKQLIEKKLGTMTEKQQELLFHFLQLVEGVEHHQQKFRSQGSVIDEIVDTAFEAGEEDFRK
ncbi:cation channel sperm-associated protein 1 isoform X1 [Canis lupus familiaris]|uniref:cation channel sperm-associated protein 1 isoform X1 n=1 Tax=Canis lupus dingo TaxID=286419 RepID=UPI000DC74C2D|nr:cation channel sperm-associated protein 1 isoform X1 [Canis lupus dingo]XP_038419789.1 cation channel sperm-associated protein 1 isoform X1 [Canis lupus familiaris]